MKKIMKRIALVLVALVVVLGLVWAGTWFYLAYQVRSLVASLAEGDGVSNPKITCAGLDVGGFPLALDAVCTGARYVDGDFSADLTDARLHFSILQPTRLNGSATSPVTLADAFTGSRQRLDWQGFAFDAGLVDWRRLSDVNLTVDELIVNNTLPIDHLIGSTERIDAHLLDIPEQHDAARGVAALSLYAEASAIDAPGFAVADGTLDVEAELNGLPDALAVFGHPDLLRRIQAAGGKLNLVGLRGADETSSFELTGTLGLDDAMRLDGQMRLNSTGLVERLDGLVPQQVQPLIVGQPAEDGSYAQTLTFKSGVIFSGLMPVGMVPPLM
jgi:hypothetical protein